MPDQPPVPFVPPDMSHVREIGPHPHDWVLWGTDGVTGSNYDACSLCGTRRRRGSAMIADPQAAWLEGGEWRGEAHGIVPLVESGPAPDVSSVLVPDPEDVVARAETSRARGRRSQE